MAKKKKIIGLCFWNLVQNDDDSMAISVRGGIRSGGSGGFNAGLVHSFFSYRILVSAMFTLVFLTTLSVLLTAHPPTFPHESVREAQLAQYNYILVVGEEEAKTGQVRDKDDHSLSIEN